MDYQMPRLDGIAASRKIREEERSRPEFHRSHIIAITANAMEEDRTEAMNAGMDDYLVKPLRPDDLRAALRRVPVV
jgi:CheY-like chemotaxis protein